MADRANWTPDALDVRLVRALRDDPRVGILALARTLGVARATVQSRLERLIRSGAMSLAPTMDPARFGYPVSALVSVELRQSDLGNPAAAQMVAIPEVTEIHSVSGQSDLLVKVVARSNEDLQRVLYRILALDQVLRTSTSILLRTFLDHRTDAVFEQSSP